MENNIFNTALIFEGGGMRASYTAAVANVLVENHLYFDNVYGLSAGSSNSVNYVSRDIWRTKESFVGAASFPQFGGLDTLLVHKGYFNAEYIYEEVCKPGNRLPFKFMDFMSNPAKLTIASFRRDTGETVYWTREHLSTLPDLMRRVRASSSLPFFMPPPLIDGYYYYDGGLGEGAGFMLPKAQRDGFERFFIVRTRPRGFRKKEANNPLALMFPRRPYLRQALNSRAQRYNQMCDLIDQLEDEGKAYVFYPENITAESGTNDVTVLEQNYAAGLTQARNEVPAWQYFLGRGKHNAQPEPQQRERIVLDDVQPAQPVAEQEEPQEPDDTEITAAFPALGNPDDPDVLDALDELESPEQ